MADVKRLLLLSDGHANQGEVNVEVLAKWAKDAFTQQGVRVSTVGLGADYDERFLAKIAHGGGGEFYYISKRDELPGLFRKELEEGRQVTVQNLIITAHDRDGARLLEMVGFPFTGGDEQHREVKLGDLFSKESRSLLLYFEVVVPDQASGPHWTPAELELTWKDIDGKKQTALLPLKLESTFEEAKVADSLDKKVHARVVETENYRALDKAMEAFRNGSQKEALKMLKEAEKRASEQAAASNDAGLLQQAGQLAQARREVEGLVEARDAQVYNTGAGLFGSRKGGSRRQIVARGGGSKATESAVDLGLRWLSKHQAVDGSWDTAALNGAESERQDATALALLAFLGAGHTETVGHYKPTVLKAVQWLQARQNTDGFVGPSDTVIKGDLASYRRTASHALATMALCEAGGMANQQATKESAQRALNWLVEQRPLVGLRQRLADAKGKNAQDILGVFWCVSALKCGKVASLKVKQGAFEEAILFLEETEVKGDDGTGHRFQFFGKDPKTAGMMDTACGLACRQFLGYRKERLYPGMAWMAEQPKALPEWGKDGADFDWHYTYLTNLTMFQTGGDSWRTWNDNLKGIMSAHQSREEKNKGMWAPVGTLKGRSKVISTALGTLYLEVYYRYLPMYR